MALSMIFTNAYPGFKPKGFYFATASSQIRNPKEDVSSENRLAI